MVAYDDNNGSSHDTATGDTVMSPQSKESTRA